MILWWLLACGPDYAEGQVQRGTLNCAWMEVCGQLELLHYVSVDDCVAAAEAQQYDESQCPNYSSKAMDACLSAYQSAIDAKDCGATFESACQVCN